MQLCSLACNVTLEQACPKISKISAPATACYQSNARSFTPSATTEVFGAPFGPTGVLTCFLNGGAAQYLSQKVPLFVL